jgi:hypothetical protein
MRSAPIAASGVAGSLIVMIGTCVASEEMGGASGVGGGPDCGR